MKDYVVYLPVEGCVSVEVKAESKDEALRKGIELIEAMSHDEICQSVQYGHYGVDEC